MSFWTSLEKFLYSHHHRLKLILIYTTALICNFPPNIQIENSPSVTVVLREAEKQGEYKKKYHFNSTTQTLFQNCGNQSQWPKEEEDATISRIDYIYLVSYTAYLHSLPKCAIVQGKHIFSCPTINEW